MKTISLLVLTLSGCLIGDPGAGASNEDILGGTADPGDASVVALRYSTWSGSSLCTATVIAPQVLLTAAHCANGYSYQYNSTQTVDWTVSPGTGWIDASFAFANPAYDGDVTHGHDVAVIVLSSATTLAPLPLGAAPVAADTVRAVGYGYTEKSASSQTGGSKFEKSFSVSSVAAHEFVGGPEATCHGDSGGPIFGPDGSIAGTTSYGDTADCNGNDHFALLSDNRDWIDSMVSTYGGGSSSGGSGGGSGSGGGGDVSTCSVQTNVNGLATQVSCTNGTCQCYLNNSLLDTCTENGSACGAGNCCGL